MLLIVRGWRSCVVNTNEVISEIWRTNDAMSSLCSSRLYSLWHQSWCPTLPLPSLPTDLSNNTTRQRSSPQATGLSNLSRRGWGCEPSAGFSASIIRRSLAGWSKLPKHSQPAHHRPKSAPSSKSMNSAPSSLKKISMLALASGGLQLWQGPRLCLWKKDDQNR